MHSSDVIPRPADRLGFDGSLWAATAGPGPRCPPLEGDARADVCVVGAGYAGLSAALHLAGAGVDTIVLEAAEPGWGASGRNGGQVIPALSLDRDDLVLRFGAERGDRLFSFGAAAADFTFALIERYGIACDATRTGWLQLAHGLSPMARLERRADAWQARGAPVELLDRDRTAALLGSEWYCGGLLDRRGGHLHPLRFARGLARAAIAAGARISGHTAARSLTRVGGQWRVRTERGEVAAQQVLLCTNAYADTGAGGGLWPGLARAMVPVYSYQIATRPLSGSLLKTVLPEAHAASDLRRLITYFRRDPQGRLVMGGRGGLDGDLARRRFRHVLSRLKTLFPQIGEPEPEFFWNGRVAFTLDRAPHLHAPAPGLFAVHGWNGRGVAAATAMGDVLSDLARGMPLQDCPLPASPLRPVRFHGLRLPAMKTAVWWKQIADRLEQGRRRPCA